MDDLGAALEQLDHRGIEADGHGARHLEDERGARRRAAPRLAGAVAVPRAVQPEVGPELEAAVELDEQVLARGIDRVDLLADDPRLTCGPGSRARAAVTTLPAR